MAGHKISNGAPDGEIQVHKLDAVVERTIAFVVTDDSRRNNGRTVGNSEGQNQLVTELQFVGGRNQHPALTELQSAVNIVRAMGKDTDGRVDSAPRDASSLAIHVEDIGKS